MRSRFRRLTTPQAICLRIGSLFQALSADLGAYRVLMHPGLPDDDNTDCGAVGDIAALDQAGYLEQWAVGRSIQFRVMAKGFAHHSRPRAARHRS